MNGWRIIRKKIEVIGTNKENSENSCCSCCWFRSMEMFVGVVPHFCTAASSARVKI
jgi:hypothetical protein